MNILKDGAEGATRRHRSMNECHRTRGPLGPFPSLMAYGSLALF